MRRACTAALLLPLLARAHGVDAGDADALLRATGGEWAPYAQAGFVHMLGGWDHLLFVAVLLLTSRRWADAAWGVTAFSLGHSVMLYAGFAAALKVPLAAVDLAIALTVAALAAHLPLRPAASTLGLRLLLAGAGLVHGLGLAGALRERLEDTVPTLGQLVAFNVGVEGAQLAVLVLLAAARPLLAPRRTALLALACAAALVLAGWQAAGWVQPQPPATTAAERAWRSDTLDFTLPPGGIASGDIEWTLQLREGDLIVYDWQASAPGTRFWSDFHGVADDGRRTQTYRRGLGAAAAGTLRAPFSGQHGWYLQNQTREPVTVRLRIAGFYAPPPAVPAP